MTHLTERGFQNTKIASSSSFLEVLSADPLLAYASEAWASHASAGFGAEEAKVRTATFIKECHAFPAFTVPGKSWFFDVLTPLHTVTIYKLPLSLLEGGIDITANVNSTTKIRRETPLMLASQLGYEDRVAYLIGLAETHVDLVDGSGLSALLKAVVYGQEAIVKLLLAYPGIQVNLRDNDGRSALILAARRGMESMIKLLLGHPEIQINCVNKRGWHALTMAASTGHERAVRLFLAHPEVQVNLLDTDGWSPLMQAAFYGKEAVVRLLLDDPRIDATVRSTRDGHTALSAAQVSRHHAILRLLQDFESQKQAAALSPLEIAQVSLCPNASEECFDSGSDEEYHDAEEGDSEAEDVNSGSSAPG